MILKPSILSKFVKANINTHRRTEGGGRRSFAPLSPPPLAKAPKGPWPEGAAKGGR